MASLEDQLAIRTLTAQYNRAFDRGEADAWVACFTEDGEFELDGRVVARGAEELGAFARRMIPRLRVRHCTTDAIIEVDGDRAAQDTYLILVDVRDGSRFLTSGVYQDVAVRRPEGWRFARRSASLDSPVA